MHFTKKHLLLAALGCLLFHPPTSAQLSWQRIEGPPGGYRHVSVGTNGELVATNTTIGLYTSDDGGQFWKFQSFPTSTHMESKFLKGVDGVFWFFDFGRHLVPADSAAVAILSAAEPAGTTL